MPDDMAWKSPAEGSVLSAEDLSEFLDFLLAGLGANPEAWENVTLERYLEALAAVFRDHRVGLLKGYETGSVPYGVLAKLLQAASIYE